MKIDKISKIKLDKNDLMVVRVGSNSRPATDADIADIKGSFEKAFKGLDWEPAIIVTHSNIDVKVYSKKKEK